MGRLALIVDLGVVGGGDGSIGGGVLLTQVAVELFRDTTGVVTDTDVGTLVLVPVCTPSCISLFPTVLWALLWLPKPVLVGKDLGQRRHWNTTSPASICIGSVDCWVVVGSAGCVCVPCGSVC